MRVFVIAKTNARVESVEEKDPTHFVVAVRALPIEGKANDAIVKVLAKYLGIPKSALVLRSGAIGKNKVFEIVT